MFQVVRELEQLHEGHEEAEEEEEASGRASSSASSSSPTAAQRPPAQVREQKPRPERGERKALADAGPGQPVSVDRYRRHRRWLRQQQQQQQRRRRQQAVVIFDVGAGDEPRLVDRFPTALGRSRGLGFGSRLANREAVVSGFSPRQNQ